MLKTHSYEYDGLGEQHVLQSEPEQSHAQRGDIQ